MIYFIQETGLFRNRVKIGFTDNIKDRLAGLRSGSPSALNLVLTLPGDIETEFVYHELFAKYRLHREWFRYGLRLRLFVWVNQVNQFKAEDKNTSYPPTLPMGDGDAGFIIQGLDIDEDLESSMAQNAPAGPSPAKQPEPLLPAHVGSALFDPVGINRLAKRLGVGSTRAKRIKTFADEIWRWAKTNDAADADDGFAPMLGLDIDEELEQ